MPYLSDQDYGQGRRLLGNDVVDTTGAVVRTLPDTPAPQPTASQPTTERLLPTGTMGDFSSMLEKPPTLPTPTYSVPALVEQENLRKASATNQINNQFDDLTEQAKERGVMEQGTANKDVNRLRGEGFSTAVNAYLDSVKKRSDDRLADLEKKKQAALAALDTDSANRIQQLMIAENERQDKIYQLQFDNALKVADLRLQEQKANQIEVAGVLYEKQPDGTYRSVAGEKKHELRELNGALYERQDDGTYKIVAGTPKNQLTEVSPGNSVIDAIGNVIYQAPNKPTASRSGGGGGGTPKPQVPLNNAVKKYIPSNVSKHDFDHVYNALSQYAQENNLNSLSTEEKYKAWGEAADDLKAAGFNPTDFDALLWEFFHPDKLAGYEKRAKEQAEKNKPTKSTKQSSREL